MKQYAYSASLRRSYDNYKESASAALESEMTAGEYEEIAEHMRKNLDGNGTGASTKGKNIVAKN